MGDGIVIPEIEKIARRGRSKETVSVTDAELALGGETVAEPGAAPDWGEKPEK